MAVIVELSISKPELGEWISLDSNMHYIITSETVLGNIVCQILYADGYHPVINYPVAILNDTSTVFAEGTTDAQGLFILDNVPAGEYRLRIDNSVFVVPSIDEDDDPHQIHLEVNASETQMIASDDPVGVDEEESKDNDIDENGYNEEYEETDV